MPTIHVSGASVRVGSDLIREVLTPARAVQPTFSRLEPLPYDPDFAGSLAAPVADPLWLIGRQWQMRELQGEDAGTPIAVHVESESARLTRFLPGVPGTDAATLAMNYDSDALPLEALIEREPAALLDRLAHYLAPPTAAWLDDGDV